MKKNTPLRIVLSMALIVLSLMPIPAYFGGLQYMRGYFGLVSALCLANVVVPFNSKRKWLIVILPSVLGLCICAYEVYAHGMCNGFDWCQY